MKKASIVLIMFMATVIFSAQGSAQKQDTAKQTNNQQVVTQSNQQQNSQNASTRGIVGGNSRTNWSKIKDMFM